MVLYRCSIEESLTYRSIRAQDSYSHGLISFLIYDNGPTDQSENTPSDWMYVSNPSNGGLPAAYNYALMKADQGQCNWLLLFDQDSDLPKNFLANLQDQIGLHDQNPTVAAIVPFVFSNDRQVSPFLPSLGFDRRYGDRDTVVSRWISAINSATSVRVSYVKTIGGFSSEFWLDYLDHWLFRKIYSTGYSVFVGNVAIKHNLSVANFNAGMEISRYKNVLKSEMYFTNHYLSYFAKLALVARLTARGIKHALLTHDKRICQLMLSAAWKQLVLLFGWVK